jgi:hypothetical protein
MGKYLERSNNVERLLRELFVADALLFTKNGLSLIVVHPEVIRILLKIAQNQKGTSCPTIFTGKV